MLYQYKAAANPLPRRYYNPIYVFLSQVKGFNILIKNGLKSTPIVL